MDTIRYDSEQRVWILNRNSISFVCTSHNAAVVLLNNLNNGIWKVIV